jgi:uncharacterized protein YllA (UPF0747 family)
MCLHSNLSDATRYIANELFKSYGLVILDADDQRLKNIFAPVMKDELLHQTSWKAVSKTILNLEKDYKDTGKPERYKFILFDRKLSRTNYRKRRKVYNSQYRSCFFGS